MSRFSPGDEPDLTGGVPPLESDPVAQAARLSRGLVLLLAVASGFAVGNLYWSQPLLGVIGSDLDVAPSAVGWLVTLTQLGYAVGIFLIVPLGDVLDRSRLVPAALTASAVALIACAVAPAFSYLAAASALLGLTSVAGQIITPLAGDLAHDHERGRVVGLVMSGVLTGILVSRTVSGLVADAFGWRVIYGVAAVVAVVLAVVFARQLPRQEPRPTMGYGALLGSVLTIPMRVQTARWCLAMGGLQFGMFTMFWTSLSLLLSEPPFDFSAGQIGLFGLAGLCGAVAAQRAGALYDRRLSVAGTGGGWGIALAAACVAYFSSASLVGLVVAVVLLDVAIQGLNILNASRLFAAVPDARSRANTAMVTANFVMGAIGSASVTALWAWAGWQAVSIALVGVGLTGFGLWLAGRRGPLAHVVVA